MKKLLFTLIGSFILLVVVFIVVAVIWWKNVSGPVGGTTSAQSFLIPKGSSAEYIGNQLVSQKLIKDKTAFKIYLRIKGLSGKIPAGDYLISQSLSLQEVVNTLLKGPYEVWVTIPEGLRREEIGLRFTKELQLTGAAQKNFLDVFMEESAHEEGFLFPDTYLFLPTVSPKSVVEKMINTFDDQYSKLGALGDKKAVILASLIERETKTDAERPIVAGIILKRLEAGWPLQIDAAVQYAVASMKCPIVTQCQNWWPELSTSNLEINSPFNTYKYPGMPPSPIANPGLSSLRAALNPQDSDYWYYIHDKNGQIHYAATLAEHNANIKKYLGK